MKILITKLCPQSTLQIDTLQVTAHLVACLSSHLQPLPISLLPLSCSHSFSWKVVWLTLSFCYFPGERVKRAGRNNCKYLYLMFSFFNLISIFNIYRMIPEKLQKLFIFWSNIPEKSFYNFDEDGLRPIIEARIKYIKNRDWDTNGCKLVKSRQCPSLFHHSVSLIHHSPTFIMSSAKMSGNFRLRAVIPGWLLRGGRGPNDLQQNSAVQKLPWVCSHWHLN